MTARRVAYLVNTYPKVSHTFIRREIQELEAQGIAVERFALRGWEAEIVDTADLEERNRTRYTLQRGLPALVLVTIGLMVARPAGFLRALGASLRLARKSLRPWPYHLVYLAHACQIYRWLEQSPVAHLHAHFGTNSTDIALLVKLLGGPGYSFTVHGMDEADNAKALNLATKVAEARFAVAISSFSRSQLLRELPAPAWPKVKIVRCALGPEFFAEEAPPLPPDPVFICVGRLSAEKAHLILLDAFAQVRQAHPAARLVLAGDGGMRPQIEARIAALGLSDGVEITGWIGSDQVRERIAKAHALVLASFIEGLPVVIMEAAAMRRVVIATYVAGIPELVAAGETGWLVPAGDVEGLAAAMRESIATPAERLHAMGLAGQAAVRKHHTIATEAAKLRALFFGPGA